MNWGKLFYVVNLSFSIHMWFILYSAWCLSSERHDDFSVVWFFSFQLFYYIAQSCENLNKQELDYQCEWRYNSCGPACPITCQHTQPLKCPLQCVEGCHVHCPAGKSIFCCSQLITVLPSRNIHRFLRMEIA